MGMTLTTAARNAAVDAVVDLLDVGSGTATLEIGTAGFGTILAVLEFSNPAFGLAAAGSAAANSIAPDTDTAVGTPATVFRAKDRNGTVVFSGTVGTSGSDIILTSVSFTLHGICNITSLSVTQPAS